MTTSSVCTTSAQAFIMKLSRFLVEKRVRINFYEIEGERERGERERERGRGR